MESILLSVNTVGPILILVLIGIILRHRGIIDDEFAEKANKLAYTYSLPFSIFWEIFHADLRSVINYKLVFYAFGSIVALVALLCLTAPRFIHGQKRRGAFIQASFRSNFAILGYVMGVSVCGEAGALPVIMLIPIVVTTYTVTSIMVLAGFSDGGGDKHLLRRVVKAVLTNPLIWGNVIGILFNVFAIPMPKIVATSVKYLAAMAAPLALIAIGAQLKLPRRSDDLCPLLACCCIKLIIAPLFFVLPAIWIGFKPAELCAIYLAHCSPTGLSSYAMSYGMGSDYEFTGQAIVFSTLFSFATIFVGLFLLSSFGYL
ncbi:MAG: AEC family transporter [Synergistaceae bacterium]|nr:AEC family transporter [Synergistaceae bacterium]